MITLEELAQELGPHAKIYNEKIYVFDQGYHTNKVKCSLYIRLKDEDFIPYCFIDTKVQPIQWARSEERKLKAKLAQRVDAACKNILKRKQ